jgi:virulence-associated protein VapD
MNLSITIPVYERYKQTYQKNKEQLTRKGITSFAGYITSTLEEMMEKNEVFARYAPFLEEFGYDEGTNTIYIKDNRTNRIASTLGSPTPFRMSTR